MISVVKPADVLTTSSRYLGVPDDVALSVTYTAAAIRRLAGALCPCSPKTLLYSMINAHRGLIDDTERFVRQVETVIDDLVSLGDLLELADVVAIDERIKGTWLFAAPPGFVILDCNTAHIVGLTPDEQLPLPEFVRDRVVLEGVSRRIFPTDGEDLRYLLGSLGLREISTESWLRHPQLSSARDLVAKADTKLSSMGPLGDQEGVQLFNHLSGSRGYRRCWEPLAAQSGRFIIRRPQAYGSDRWCYGEIASGQVAKLLEFPEPGERWRGCDVAWRLMMALLHLARNPVSYHMARTDGVGAFDFFFPMPDWAKRALRFSGDEVPARKCLNSFDIPEPQVPAAQHFLAQMLFLVSRSD